MRPTELINANFVGRCDGISLEGDPKTKYETSGYSSYSLKDSTETVENS